MNLTSIVTVLVVDFDEVYIRDPIFYVPGYCTSEGEHYLIPNCVVGAESRRIVCAVVEEFDVSCLRCFVAGGTAGPGLDLRLAAIRSRGVVPILFAKIFFIGE